MPPQLSSLEKRFPARPGQVLLVTSRLGPGNPMTASEDSNQQGRKGGLQESRGWQAPMGRFLPGFLTSCLPDWLPRDLHAFLGRDGWVKNPLRVGGLAPASSGVRFPIISLPFIRRSPVATPSASETIAG